uniref:Ribosomal protein L34Ae n=1 Tax=Noccaea caerulescens TaxID=107243 RepID=A0A1J3JWM2_NOCCA
MIESENSRIDEEEGERISESPPKFVFKFAFQTETLERVSREGYRSLSETESEKENSFSSSSPVISTAANKYETPSPAKNLTFVVENLKAATFRVEDCLKEKKREKTEKVYSVSSVEKKKTRFLTEDDFLESDSDSSHTFTSNEGRFLSDSDFGETSPEEDEKGQNRKNDNSGSVSGSDSEDGEEEEDTNEFESLWEHQDLIEQLKMEMKKVKAIGGLPTIREEDECCPKIMEDLKPWRIEEEKKFKHVDTIGEVHKFHRSYRERMRKLDILSFQKSYALGLLQSKNTQQATSTVGSSPSHASFPSVFSVNLRLWKPKKSETEPMVQFIKEIHGELENVYVGHMCLSWEILHWQYQKAIQLHESDVYGSRRYNEVAGEFQQFQVLLQRFLENEPFEEPRVQHYIKKRCVLRNLLQVPVIREDGNKDKRKGRRRDCDENDDKGAIKSDQLVEIMEETIRLFWRFVRCDKLTSSIHDQKSRTKSQIEPDHEEDSEDLEMFAEVKLQVQNKEKRLKHVLKSERCIIRRFHKQKEEDSTEDQVLHFFSQVDMKLVTRVLNMSKLTKDHLVWCHNKLNKISFVNRRLLLDPSFCLFPC